MSLTIFTTSGQFIVYKYLSNRSKNNPVYLYYLKKILETMSYCFSTSLMDHTTMIIISKFIFSLFESPKHPKFDLNHLELKIICPNFVQSIATQGSRSCQFPKPKQTFSWMKQKKVKKMDDFEKQDGKLWGNNRNLFPGCGKNILSGKSLYIVGVVVVHGQSYYGGKIVVWNYDPNYKLC